MSPSLSSEEWAHDNGLLHYRPWTTEGIMHGFLGAKWNFSKDALDSEAQRFCMEYRVSALFLPTQVHGDAVIKISSELISRSHGLMPMGEGDALLVKNLKSAEKAVAIGIRTADCLPLLFRCGESAAVVHAGWRGLAAGIIQKNVFYLRSLNPNAALQVLIGPAAGPLNYEVGHEVIEALKPHACFEKAPLSSEKFLLSLSGTAERILEQAGGKLHCVSSTICTITSSDFHSHRRDKDLAGRNLAFMLIGVE